MNNQKITCAMAYHGISLNQDGSLDPCCQYTTTINDKKIYFTNIQDFNNTVRQSLHDNFSNNIKPPGCQKCFSEEENGLKSLRQYANEWYESINELTNDPILYDLELRLGNFCNLQCIMCFPKNSTSIQVERETHVEKFKVLELWPSYEKIPPWWESEQFISFTEHLLKHAKRVNITGGEPFIIPEVLNMLDKLMPQKDTVDLEFNTNLTKLSVKLLNKLKKFQFVSISVSLEGVREMNNYLRYPSDWAVIEKNIQTLRAEAPNINLKIHHTFQHASAYSLPALVTFCHENNLELTYTSVQGNDFLKLDSVPTDVLSRFKSWAATSTLINDGQRSFILKSIAGATFDQSLYQKYRDYVGILDSIRKTKYDEIFN